jgi:hypothetical protein
MDAVGRCTREQFVRTIYDCVAPGVIEIVGLVVFGQDRLGWSARVA